MRHTIFFALGVLEFLVSLVLLTFAWRLPGPDAVHDSVGRVEAVSRQASEQVRRLREQLQVVRRNRPQMQNLALRLQDQLRLVTDNLRDQQVDFETVRTVGDSLGDVATGLDGMSDTLDPAGVGQIGAGLKGTADYLDRKVAPAASRAADRLDKATEGLRADAVRLGALLKESPLDLEAIRQMHDSLGKFDKGLGQMNAAFRPEQLAAIREGFKGLETSLSTGAADVERVAGYTYPSVSFDGLRANVEQKPLWPDGGKIAEGMRKAAKGVAAASKELDGLAAGLPRVGESLKESRKALAATRTALGNALKLQEKAEPLLKDVPQHAARLAEELPQLGADLSKVLRDTARLREVAGMLRQTQKGIDAAVSRWPELRKNLGRSAVLLRDTQANLNKALAHRGDYERTMQHTLLLIRTFSAALPLMTEQLEADLEEQERSLAHLGGSIDGVSDALPACSQGASQMLQTARLLLCLVALIFAIHGSYLVLDSRLGGQLSK